ncbi:MAG TPA: MOSC domain-containing protein [Armatimonadota bacterium]|jgi:MOSC domain-containing protein YiiM
MAHLSSIVYKPKEAPQVEGAYTRVPVVEARLVADYGIEGDAKGGSGTRQLNIMCAEALEGLAREGFTTEPGLMGEQLIVSGLDVDALKPGDVLALGSEARAEVVEPRVGCARFEQYQGKQREDAGGRMGVMARVTASGTIRVGDPVSLVGG